MQPKPAVADAEGFTRHPYKTRCLPAHQQQRINGVVVNTKPKMPRSDYDRLKACLHQCVLHGGGSQNTAQIADFRAHLLGRIGWVQQLNPDRAVKLARMFDRISW